MSNAYKLQSIVVITIMNGQAWSLWSAQRGRTSGEQAWRKEAIQRLCCIHLVENYQRPGWWQKETEEMTQERFRLQERECTVFSWLCWLRRWNRGKSFDINTKKENPDSWLVPILLKIELWPRQAGAQVGHLGCYLQSLKAQLFPGIGFPLISDTVIDAKCLKVVAHKWIFPL